MTTNRPSLRELLGVWLVGAVGEVFAYDRVKDPETVLTAPVVAAGLVFILMPAFLVVYTLVWAWPLAARGDRAAVSALVLFAVAVEATSGWSWIGIQSITLTTVLMRVLSVLSPLAFVACAASAAWVYGRRVSLEARAAAIQRTAPIPAAPFLDLEEAVQGPLVRGKLMAMLVRRARRV